MKLLDEKYDKLKLINLILLAFVVAIIPLIVYLRLVELNETIQGYWMDAVNHDFFSFYKMFWLVLAGFFLVTAFAAYISRKRLVKSYYYLPAGVYAFFALLSSVLSRYRGVAMLGFPDRYEGLAVLLVYILLMIVALNVVDNKQAVKIVLGALFISAFILGIHGLLQFLGWDFFQTEIGSRMILPPDLKQYTDKLGFQFPDKRIYSTMFNPNYVGSYGSLLVLLPLGLYITNIGKKIMYYAGGFSVLMFAYMIGSQSRAGMVGFIAGAMVLGLLLRKKIWANWKPVLIIMVAFILVFVTMDAYSINDILSEVFVPETEMGLREEEVGVPEVEDISSEDNKLRIETESAVLNLELGDEQLTFLDQEGEPLDITVSQKDDTPVVGFVNDDYKDHNFILQSDEGVIHWKYGDRNVYFPVEDNKFRILGMKNQIFKIKEAPSWGFEGRERMGSSRGYIWSRTIPLLRETWLLGYGADNYAMYFPQHDVVGKFMYLSSTHKIVDKPHNIYLQQAVNTGIISLLALLVLWGGYLLQSMIIYWDSDFEGWEARVGVAIMAAVAAYLVTGLFNDSVVSVAPVFWVLLGVGISLNRLQGGSVQE